MRCLSYVVGAMLLCCIIVSCGKKCTEPTPSFIYFNSFESAEDTTGWQGITEEMFVGHPAPGGGNRSLYIGGGCIQPTAYIDLPSQTDKGNYTVSCWGKVAEVPQVGKIVLAIAEKGEEKREIQLKIASKDWTFYESEESLHCSANNKLRLEIWIGGFAPAHMLIDRIKIEKVK